MAELAVRNIEYNSIKDFLPLGLMRKKYKLRLRIDKIPDQPRTSHAIDFNFFARDPFHARTLFGHKDGPPNTSEKPDTGLGSGTVKFPRLLANLADRAFGPRQSFGGAVLVLERIDAPEPPRYLISVFLAFFLLGLLIMSAEIFSAAINKDARFLAILVHDCFVAFLALASFFFDSKDLIATGLVLDGGLVRFRHILHLDLRFFVRRLRHHSKGEASADDSCCNQFPGFHVIFSLTPFRLDSLNLYSADA